MTVQGVSTNYGVLQLSHGALVRFDGIWWSYVYRATVLRYAGEVDPRVIVVLEPVARVPMLACSLLFGDAYGLRPYRPFIPGGVLAAAFVVPGAQGPVRMVSVANAGELKSYNVGADVFHGALFRYHRSERHKDGTLQQALAKIPDEAVVFPIIARMTDYLVVDGNQVQGLGECSGWSVPHVDEGPMPGGGYTVVYTDTDLDAIKDKSRVYHYPVAMGGGLATEHRSNDLRSVQSRVVEVANDKEPPEVYNTYASEFMDLVFGEDDGLGRVAPFNMDQVSDAMDKPSQKQGRDLTEVMWDLFTTVKVKAFQKFEALAKISDPRNISTVPPEHMVLFGRFTLALSKYLTANASWYVFGGGCGETARRVHAICCRYLRISATDYSRFDGTLSAWLMAFRQRFFVRAFGEGYAQQIRQSIAAKVCAEAKTRNGIFYNAGFGQLSGDVDTSVGNTVVNAFTAYCRYRLAGYSPAEAYAMLGLFGGDDGFTPCPEDDGCYEQVATDLGLRLKHAVTPVAEGVEFLGRFYPTPQLNAGSAYPWDRMVTRMHIVAAPAGISLEQAMVNRAEGFAVTDPETPLIAEWIGAVRRANPGLQAQWTADDWFMRNYRAQNDPYPPMALGRQEAFKVMCERGDYDPSQASKLIEWLATHSLTVGCKPPVLCEEQDTAKFAYYRDGVIIGAIVNPPKLPRPMRGKDIARARAHVDELEQAIVAAGPRADDDADADVGAGTGLGPLPRPPPATRHPRADADTSSTSSKPTRRAGKRVQRGRAGGAPPGAVDVEPVPAPRQVLFSTGSRRRPVAPSAAAIPMPPVNWTAPQARAGAPTPVVTAPVATVGQPSPAGSDGVTLAAPRGGQVAGPVPARLALPNTVGTLAAPAAPPAAAASAPAPAASAAPTGPAWHGYGLPGGFVPSIMRYSHSDAWYDRQLQTLSMAAARIPGHVPPSVLLHRREMDYHLAAASAAMATGATPPAFTPSRDAQAVLRALGDESQGVGPSA
jgi:hypothetical protein